MKKPLLVSSKLLMLVIFLFFFSFSSCLSLVFFFVDVIGADYRITTILTRSKSKNKNESINKIRHEWNERQNVQYNIEEWATNSKQNKMKWNEIKTNLPSKYVCTSSGLQTWVCSFILSSWYLHVKTLNYILFFVLVIISINIYTLYIVCYNLFGQMQTFQCTSSSIYAFILDIQFYSFWWSNG